MYVHTLTFIPNLSCSIHHQGSRNNYSINPCCSGGNGCVLCYYNYYEWTETPCYDAAWDTRCWKGWRWKVGFVEYIWKKKKNCNQLIKHNLVAWRLWEKPLLSLTGNKCIFKNEVVFTLCKTTPSEQQVNTCRTPSQLQTSNSMQDSIFLYCNQEWKPVR